ncbi:hypothetical protein UY900_10645, partial [Escherichia coli]|nr:hypothetical protein [Escherichia coli]
NRLIRCVCGKKIGPDPRNFNQRVSLGRNDLLIRTFPRLSVAIHYSQILQPIIIQACEPIKAALTKLTLCQTDRIFIQIWLCQHLL